MAKVNLLGRARRHKAKHSGKPAACFNKRTGRRKKLKHMKKSLRAKCRG